MTYTTALIMEWLSSILWPLARVSSLLMVMAVFGSRLAPARIRIGLALAITFLVSPLLPKMPPIELFSVGSFLVLAQQLLIGIALGLMTQFLMESFVMAGQVIAMQTSLGFATLVDPMNGQATPVVGQFYLMLATLVFLALDGHLVMLRLVILSFETLPVSDSGLSVSSMQTLSAFLGVMYQAALVMSLSAIVALLLINFAFGVMTRAAPQLNIFSIGFAVSMMSGLLILWLTIGGFLGHFDSLWERVQEVSCELIDTQCLGAPMADTDQERTEQPTGKRLQQAREKGQIARSKELGTASVLLSAVFGLLMLKGALASAMIKVLTTGFTLDREQAFDPNAMIAMVPALLGELILPLGLLFALVTIAAFIGNTLMGGMNFSTEAMMPKFSKLSPLNGLKRMFGVQSLVELVKSIAKVVFISLFAWWMLSSQFNHLLNLSMEGYPGGIIDALELFLWMLIILCCALIPIVAIDVPFQQWNHMRQLKMTKQEIKDEFRDSEGKPEVKGRIRRLQMEMAARRMMGEVPKADVVITNPTHYSVALKYEAGKPGAAPKVIAKGTDEVAMKIREIAREYTIPIMPSPELTRAIYHSTELGREIPEGLFAAVAQVLAYVFQLKKFRRGHGRRPQPLAKDLPIPPEYRK